jgi:basic membrane protein A
LEKIYKFKGKKSKKGGVMKDARRVIIIALVMIILSLTVFSGCSTKKVEEKPAIKIAAIFIGVISDADWTTLGYNGLLEVGNAFNTQVAYSQKVAVSDAEGVMRGYIADGYNVIFAHSAEYGVPVDKIAAEFPNVTFIRYAEVDPAGDAKPNEWYINRNYFSGAYVLGSLAALATKTGKIGFVGALELPFLRGQINAIKQAIKDLGSNAQFDYVFVGSFDDPVVAKQAAEGFISKGADILINVVNLGVYGVFAAAKEAKSPVYVTCMYSDKGASIPNNYLCADLFNFTPTLKSVVGEILNGKKGGYFVMKFGENEARYPQLPIQNVSEEINNKVTQIAQDVASGKIQVNIVIDKILP